MDKRWIALLVVAIAVGPVLSACTTGEKGETKDVVVSEPKHTFAELDRFQPILGKVVFVTKEIAGGDFRDRCTLQGKVKNVTETPIKDVYIIWALYDENGKLFPVYTTSSNN